MRRPRRVYGVGDEPDPRFTLANERTMLAWLRTALALVVAGVAAVAVSHLTRPRWLVNVTASLAFVSGAATAVLGYARWQLTERALRLRQPLPSGVVALVTVGAVLLIAVVGAIALGARA